MSISAISFPQRAKRLVSIATGLFVALGLAVTPAYASAATSYTGTPSSDKFVVISDSSYQELAVNLTGTTTDGASNMLMFNPGINSIVGSSFDYLNQQVIILGESYAGDLVMYKMPLASRSSTNISMSGTTLVRSSSNIPKAVGYSYRLVVDDFGAAYLSAGNGSSPREISTVNLDTGVVSASPVTLTAGFLGNYCQIVWNPVVEDWFCWNVPNGGLNAVNINNGSIGAAVADNNSWGGLEAPAFDSSGNLWGKGFNEIQSLEIAGGATSDNPFSHGSYSPLNSFHFPTVIRLRVTWPSDPTGFTATAGDGSVDLSWTAPADGGAAITDYVIEKRETGGSNWLTVADGTSTATAYTVTGLTNGTSYDFRVSARNRVGTGATSIEVAATPAGASNGGGSGGGSNSGGEGSQSGTGNSDSKTLNKSVLFTSGSLALTNSAKKSIRAIVKKAGKNAKYTITGTAGVTAGVPKAYISNLAKLRAKAVKTYLVKLGVSKKNITIKTKLIKAGLSPKTKILAKYTVA